MYKTQYKWLILIVSFIHVVWGLLIFRSLDALMTTPTYALALFIPNNNLLAFILFAAAFLGIIGYMEDKSETKKLLYLLPQQICLFISAFGSLYMILNGHYADGITRSFDFMLSDQIPIMAIALGHFFSIIQYRIVYLFNRGK